MCKSTWNPYQSLRAFQKLLANFELLQTLYASEEPNSRFLFFSAPTHQMGFSEEWRLASIQFRSSWHSTSVQSWKIMFRKCSCIVKVSGGRFLRLWRQTLLTDYPHCGICSAKDSGRDTSLCFSEPYCRRMVWAEKAELPHCFSLLSIILYSQALEMTV